MIPQYLAALIASALIAGAIVAVGMFVERLFRGVVTKVVTREEFECMNWSEVLDVQVLDFASELLAVTVRK